MSIEVGDGPVKARSCNRNRSMFPKINFIHSFYLMPIYDQVERRAYTLSMTLGVTNEREKEQRAEGLDPELKRKYCTSLRGSVQGYIVP